MFLDNQALRPGHNAGSIFWMIDWMKICFYNFLKAFYKRIDLKIFKKSLYYEFNFDNEPILNIVLGSIFFSGEEVYF